MRPGETTYPIDFVKAAMQEHFKITDVQGDFLPFAYTNFQKSTIASFCTRVAEGARKGDRLCQEVFRQAGEDLGLHVRALIPKIDSSLLANSQGFRIVCVGSVWQSFDLLREGFDGALPLESFPHGYQLVKVKGACTIGAAIHASKTLGLGVHFNADDHVEVFHLRK